MEKPPEDPKQHLETKWAYNPKNAGPPWGVSGSQNIYRSHPMICIVWKRIAATQRNNILLE